ncbi:DUF3299 domain-containing protein [Paramylibacter ulvae]|nr:DUF3299 domain-containing protein [Amylibacter ulvae]
MTRIHRRSVLAGLCGISVIPPFANAAEEYVDLEWTDLVPKGQVIIPQEIQELTQHSQSTPRGKQPQSTGVRSDWNGQTVRLRGFIVPIDYSGTGVTAFILVPFVGACVHVPPPPANQLVFVTTETPYESSGLYEPVNVTGMFGTASTTTQLAEIAYALSADRIEPYGD